MHVADPGVALGDDAGARLKAAQKHVVRMDLGRRYADRRRRLGGRAADQKRHGAANLAAERVDGAKRAAIDRDDFVANEKSRLMAGRALHHAGDEGPALVVGPGEDADSRIGHLAPWENAVEAATAESVGEDIGQLIIGGIVRRIVARVRSAELHQHRIDDGGRFVARARGRGLRPVAGARRLPVDAAQARIVETVAHRFPDFVERREIGVRLAPCLSACRPCAKRSGGGR